MILEPACVYVLRIWREESREGGVWRASVMDTLSHEKHYFASREALIHFLGLEPDLIHEAKKATNAEAQG